MSEQKKSKFSDRFIDALPYSKKPTYYWDASIPAFGIRVGKNRKTFTVIRGKSRERLSIGTYPAVSLQSARLEAKRLLIAKARTAPSLPISEALEEFIRLHCNKLKGGRQMVWNLNAHVTPIALHKVDRIYVQRILDELADRPSEANHFFQYFRTFMMWCVRRGYLEHYPLTAMTMPHKIRSRDRVLKPDELKAIWRALKNDTFSNVVRVLIYTGARRNEPKHFTLDGNFAVLPSNRAKNGVEHRIPVTDAIKHLLTTNLSWGGWSKSKAQLDKACRVTDWTLHDLRRTFLGSQMFVSFQFSVLIR